LDEIACQSEQGCRLLVSKERVINSHCECCETFAFDVGRSSDGSSSEHLNNVIVHYSARSQERVVDAARELAKAVGVSNRDVAKVGDDSVQRYEWKDSRAHVQENYLLEVRFTHADRNWELYLALSAEPL
jgi:hypothetical protein